MKPLSPSFDLVVAGGTPGGIACACRAARLGLKVLLANLSGHLGGMFSGGLSTWDSPFDGFRSELTDEYHRRLRAWYVGKYGRDSNQLRQTQETPDRRSDADLDQRSNLIWKWEPQAAEAVLTNMVQEEANITVLNHVFPLTVERMQRAIVSVLFRSFRGGGETRVAGRIFVDASYEGDLAAHAGVPFRVGRESRAEFDEPHAGRIFSRHGNGKFPAEANRGVLNLRRVGNAVTQEIMSGSTGEGDAAVQAYNYRLCLTQRPDNRRSIEKPATYDRAAYLGIVEDDEAINILTPYPVRATLLLGDVRRYLIRPRIGPNDKVDVIDGMLIGGSADYPNGTWELRREICRRHRDHALGLFYFLQNDPSVPADVRSQLADWGLAKDEFVDNDNFPYELYVREARRIMGHYVFSENDACLAPGLGRARVQDDAIATTDWPMDSLECTLARTLGSFYDGKIYLSEKTRPAQVPYRIVVAQGVDNLLVPVCMSSTHVGWGTLRLEPVFMQVGESCAFAAQIALARGCALIAVPRDELKRRLVSNRVMISFFNEFDPACGESWAPAIQYLGTLGFFPSYDAKPSEPLRIETARAWIEALIDLLRGRLEADRLSRQLFTQERTPGASISSAEFLQLIQAHLTFHSFVRLAERAAECGANRGQAALPRAAAAQWIYELLETSVPTAAQ